MFFYTLSIMAFRLSSITLMTLSEFYSYLFAPCVFIYFEQLSIYCMSLVMSRQSMLLRFWDRIFDIFDLLQALAMTIVLERFCYFRTFFMIFLLNSLIFWAV
jgi:hypothetical protein